MSILLKDLKLPKCRVTDSPYGFVYKCLENIKTNKYTKFDPNIQYGSRVMRIITN